MELPVLHECCATERTRQWIPDLASRNGVVDWRQQDTIVCHDLAKRCGGAQSIQAGATRRVLLRDRHVSPAHQGLTVEKEIAGPVPLVFIIIPRDLARTGQ